MIEVKPTLAGLAEALNTLLANGADPNAEVKCNHDTEIFDGFVDTESIENAEERGARTRLRIILSVDDPDEVRQAKELPPLARMSPAFVPDEDSEYAAIRRSVRREGDDFSPADYARLAEVARRAMPRVLLSDVVAELEAFEVPADLEGEFAAVGVRLAKEHLQKGVRRR